MPKTPRGSPKRSSVARPTHVSVSSNDAISPSRTSLHVQGPAQPIFGLDTGQEAADITHAGADESSARSVSCRVRQTRNDETFSKRVRPTERPSPPPGTKACAAASWVLRRMIPAASWSVAASARRQHATRNGLAQKMVVRRPTRPYRTARDVSLGTSRSDSVEFYFFLGSSSR